MSTVLIFVSACLLAQEPVDLYTIPLRPDPPIAVDGVLSDWASVPGQRDVEEPGHAVFGASEWSGPDDCSGHVRMAWRQEALFLAVEVTDDAFWQPNRGADVWKGDHVELYLDLSPHTETGRAHFGHGQFQIALSPGSFGGEPAVSSVAEIVCYKPEGAVLEGAQIASVQMENGYALEAAIPWPALGITEPAEGLPLRVEVGLSDSDIDGTRQETLLTVGTGTWEHVRTRLASAVLSRADGHYTGAWGSVSIAPSITLQRGESTSLAAAMAPPPGGMRTMLTLLARVEFDQPAGYTPALRVTVNGTALEQEHVVNKPLRARSRGGDVYSLSAGDRFSTFYAPDFTGSDNDPHYGLLDGIQSCLFVFDVTELQTGDSWNIEIAHAADEAITQAMVLKDVRIDYGLPSATAIEKAGPPEGPIPFIEPDATPAAFEIEVLPESKIQLATAGADLVVESRFSTPDAQWVSGANSYFGHERRVDRQAEAVFVHDTFTNLTGEQLPIMQRHSVQTPQERLWIAGLEQVSGGGGLSSPDNPTVFAAWEDGGIGLVALGDVMRIHMQAFAGKGLLTLADQQLVIGPHATYTATWLIVPARTGSYWAFLNALRRATGANFTIDGGFAFLRSGPLTDAWSDEQYQSFIRYKDAKYTCMTIDYPRYNGTYTHGTSFQRIDLNSYVNGVQRRKRLVPESKSLVYFHCFIDVVEDAAEQFADSRVIGPDGKQADYGLPHDRIFFPTDSNSYGPAIARNVDLILDTIGAAGVYWDEHEYSRWHYHYGEPWDGYSGDIDGDTHEVTRLKSSVTLLTEPWRVALAKRILAKGALIGNGVPYTRSMADLRFPCFVETGSITHCARAHMHSPIALGDHLTERNEQDAYNTMLAALDYGCVYHWYNDMTVIPTHHTLTQHMYPITPMELHEGYLIGEERIITKKSGMYGWGDMSEHETHVYDDTGREAEGFAAPRVVIDGKAYTELRIGEGWSAAIVKK
ncbi:MAG: hypothetical protein AMXMBFR84_02830 [Candidatus Hydrogenedentota bacterium]